MPVISQSKTVEILFGTTLAMILGLFVLHTTPVFAREVESAMPTNEFLRQEGQLLTVKISRGSPLRIFVIGREEAKLDLSTLSLTVRRIKPYPGQLLTVGRDKDHFVIQNSSELKKTDEIEIESKLDGNTEKFRFELK